MANKVQIFNRAFGWIKENTIHDNGMAVTSKNRIIYPEVTGYYIPTLLLWGERELASAYAKYLCSIQKPDGSWYDSGDNEPYVFDSAQILKGLLSIRDILPEVDEHIIKGCDWIISNVREDGRLTTPSKAAWGDDEGFCSELVHIYCLSPLIEAGNVFNKEIYKEKAYYVLKYYKSHYYDKIMNFSLLSHFYAYVMEGLFDMGEEAMVREAMAKLDFVQNEKGGIPGLNDVKWVCSTGMFQLALVWYKLGELERGNKIFDYACSLQNKSGGWFGSYPVSFLGRFAKGKQKAYYFPNEEISWANKYFFDALSYKMKLTTEEWSDWFSDSISESDGRYQLMRSELLSIGAGNGEDLEILDAGCGKGRYLRNLIKELPHNNYYASDLSEKVMAGIPLGIEKKQGSLTKLPYEDNKFDYVYVVEALEHAVHIKGALNELSRVAKPGGKIVIIDKPTEALGRMKIEDWEQWIDGEQIKKFVSSIHGTLRIIENVGYEGGRKDGLFRAWIINKK